MSFEDEDLVLKEWGESPIKPHPKEFRLRPNLTQNVGVELGDGSLQYVMSHMYMHVDYMYMHVDYMHIHACRLHAHTYMHVDYMYVRTYMHVDYMWKLLHALVLYMHMHMYAHAHVCTYTCTHMHAAKVVVVEGDCLQLRGNLFALLNSTLPQLQGNK